MAAALSPGTRLGPYEVVAAIGAGGMGEVFRARDTRPELSREVAIKVLTGAADADRRRRLEAEARATGALNHPNILAIYDVGVHDGALYLVEELVDGSTLRELLLRGPLAPRRVADIGRSIASGLAAAHAKDIIHRDLKPENVMVGIDGRVRILDFGLAKLGEAKSSTPEASTQTHATDPGTVLGTVAYMSPEQVRGQPLDARSDLFAFGVLLYELLAGRRPFSGESAADTQAAILHAEPDELSADERQIPSTLGRIVHRCLEKRPDQRFQSATDLAFALETLSSGGNSASGASAAADERAPTGDIVDEAVGRTSGRAWSILGSGRGVTAAAVVSVVIGAVVAMSWPRPTTSTAAVPDEYAFTIPPPVDGQFYGGPFSAPGPQLSADGRQLAFEASGVEGNAQIWLRSMDEPAPRALPGTDGGSSLAWSPDGRALAFVQGTTLKTLDVQRGFSQVLANDAVVGTPVAWGTRDEIIYGAVDQGLHVVPARGGTTRVLTTPQKQGGDVQHTMPMFLPDGRHYLYLVLPAREIRLADLESDTATTLLAADSGAQYAQGHLLYMKAGTLTAQPFDLRTLRTLGDAAALVQVRGNESNGRAAFSVSSSGVLVYRSTAGNENELVIAERTGRRRRVGLPRASYIGQAFSPDLARGLVHRHEIATGGGLWEVELGSGSMVRATAGRRHEDTGIFSPDGKRIVFSAEGTRLFEQPVGQLERARELPGVTSGSPTPTDWKGSIMLFDRTSADTARDIWAVDMGTMASTPRPIVATKAFEGGGRLSPDGRTLAYVSDEAGTPELYVRSLGDGADRQKISNGYATQASWLSNTRLFFHTVREGRSVIMEAVRPNPSLPFETPVVAYEHDRRLYDAFFGGSVAAFGVRRNGDEFVFLEQERNVEPLTVVTNWRSLLPRNGQTSLQGIGAPRE